MTPRSPASHGFCLLEVVVATTTLIVALSALAQLMSLAALATRRAGVMTTTAVLAQQKIEELVPLAATGAVGPGPAPPDALARNVDGYCDFVDARGAIVGRGTMAPAAAMYVRRWAIEPLSTSPATLMLQVVVADVRGPGGASTSGAPAPGLRAARIASLVRIES